MKTVNIKISEAAKNELRAARIDGDKFDLVGQVSNYQEIKKVLNSIGIIWNKKLKTHIMEPGAKEKLDDILNGGQIVDKKKTLQAFYTPEELAKRVVELADVKGKRLLEPSAGSGRLVDAAYEAGAAHVTCVEICPDACKELTNKGYEVLNLDFLNTVALEHFDRLLMNPPFSRGTDIKHVAHAYKHLAPGGRLVSIMAGNTEKKQFQELIQDKDYEIHEVEEGAFKESGTLIKTIILVLNK